MTPTDDNGIIDTLEFDTPTALLFLLQPEQMVSRNQRISVYAYKAIPELRLQFLQGFLQQQFPVQEDVTF